MPFFPADNSEPYGYAWRFIDFSVGFNDVSIQVFLHGQTDPDRLKHPKSSIPAKPQSLPNKALIKHQKLGGAYHWRMHFALKTLLDKATEEKFQTDDGQNLPLELDDSRNLWIGTTDCSPCVFSHAQLHKFPQTKAALTTVFSTLNDESKTMRALWQDYPEKFLLRQRALQEEAGTTHPSRRFMLDMHLYSLATPT